VTGAPSESVTVAARLWERGGVLGGVLGGVDLESVAIFLLFVSPNNLNYPAGFFVEACTTVLQYSTVLNIANIGISIYIFTDVNVTAAVFVSAVCRCVGDCRL
jgi:hypothetical protein